MIDEVLEDFLAGSYALCAKELRLQDRPSSEVRAELEQRGFARRVHGIVAYRNAQAEPRWLRLDGTVSAERDPTCVTFEEYLHADGSVVRIYGQGDPRERDAPKRGPYAVKLVVFPDSPSTYEGVVTFNDVAFRVSDAGKPLPKSRRHAYGVPFDGLDPVASWTAAEIALGDLAFLRLRG